MKNFFKKILPLVLILSLFGSAVFATVVLPPTMTRGDILFATSTSIFHRLATSTEGYVLTISSGIPAWAVSAGGGGADTDWVEASSTHLYASTSYTHIGIATATPAYTLDVWGQLRVNATSTFENNISMSNAGDAYVYFNAGADYLSWDDGGDAFFFSNDITTNDNLTVGGDLTVTGTSSLAVIEAGTWQGTAIDISDYTNLTVGATGIELSDDDIALTATYVIPLDASTTEWANAYTWKSSAIDGSDRLKMAYGGTEADLSAITTGGMITGTGAGAVGVFNLGTDGYYLMASSSAAGGVEWTAVAGAGDVTAVGDCAAGDCFDGTSDGGTYLNFYDAQGIGQLITGDLTGAHTWTLPDATGTVIVSGHEFTGDVTAALDTDGSTALSFGSAVIVEADLDADEAPADNDILTFDTTGDNFSWQTPGELTLMEDGDIDTFSEIQAWVTDEVLLASSSIDTFNELNIIVADKTLVNEEDAITFDSTVLMLGAVTIDSYIKLGDSKELEFGSGLDFSAGYVSADDTVKFALGADCTSNTLWSFSSTTFDVAISATLATTTVSGGLTLPNDSITDAMIDWGNLTDLAAGGEVTWGNITAGELANDSIIDADIDDDGNFTFTGTWDFSGGDIVLPAGSVDAGTYAAGSIDVNDIAADTITHTNIADADQAQPLCIWFENPTADDDFNSIWMNISGNDFLITEVKCESDQTIDFDLQVDDGSPADVLGTDLQCAAGENSTTTIGGDATVADNEELDLVVTSVSGTPTWVSICWGGNWVD